MEDINKMLSLCKLELKKLQQNCGEFLEESAAMLNVVEQAMEEGQLKESSEKLNIYKTYDKHMSKLREIMKLARKMNIDLQLSMLCDDNPYSGISINKNSLPQKVSGQNNAVTSVFSFDEKSVLNESYSTDEADPQPTAVDSFQAVFENIRRRDLSRYTENYVFSATIMHVEDYENCLFYTLEESYTDMKSLCALGESYKLHTLSLKYEALSTSLLKCKLLGIHGRGIYDNCRNYLAAVLKRNEFKCVTFTVIQNVRDVLHVKMHRDPVDMECSSYVKDERTCENSYPFYTYHEIAKGKTAGEDTICVAQPTMLIPDKKTTNVIEMQSLTADENNCTTNISNVEKGIVTFITVTHVESVTVFYAYFDSGAIEPTVFSIPAAQLKSDQKLTLPPLKGALILAQYSIDHVWYRAKVMSFDQKNNLFEVFYVDFGNTEILPLKSLAVCPYTEKEAPFRAVRFRLGDIYDVTDGNGHAVETLMDIILHQTFAVKVLSKNPEELSIRIIDSNFTDVPKILLKLGYAKEK